MLKPAPETTSGGGTWGDITGILADQTDLNSALSAKADASDLSDYAPLASPALTGNPTAPTQSAGNDSTRVATTAFVSTAVASRTHAQTIGNGTDSAYVVTHNLGSDNIITMAWDVATGAGPAGIYPTKLDDDSTLWEAAAPVMVDEFKVVAQS